MMKNEKHKAYILQTPKLSYTVPLVVSCPHAGVYTPSGFEDNLSDNVSLIQFLSRGDIYTDALTQDAVEHGATQIISAVAPAYLNVGRAINSIHPNDVRGDVATLNVDPHSVYVQDNIGQGLVAVKSLYGGDVLYKENSVPNEDEIQNRIENFYTPYHETLERLVEEKSNTFGHCFVYDIHSCPDIAPMSDKDAGQARKDIILGDANGQSCDASYVQNVVELAKDFEYSISVNQPYTGGFITRKYSQSHPDNQNTQSLQIEFNRRSFGLNEQTMEIERNDEFVKMREFARQSVALISRHL